MRFSSIDDVPYGFATDEVLVRPIVVADTELDYDAVMESRVYLRPWEQTGWPADDFTLEEDRDDVVMLETRHRELRAFTYTVMDPEQTECLGCVYFMPPDAKSYTDSRITALGEQRWDEVGAAVNFWVRTSRLADGLDRRLLEALRAWLDDEWDVGPIVIVTNEQVEQQMELYSSVGLEPRFRIAKDGQAGDYLAFS